MAHLGTFDDREHFGARSRFVDHRSSPTKSWSDKIFESLSRSLTESMVSKAGASSVSSSKSFSSCGSSTGIVKCGSFATAAGNGVPAPSIKAVSSLSRMMKMVYHAVSVGNALLVIEDYQRTEAPRLGDLTSRLLVLQDLAVVSIWEGSMT